MIPRGERIENFKKGVLRIMHSIKHSPTDSLNKSIFHMDLFAYQFFLLFFFPLVFSPLFSPRRQKPNSPKANLARSLINRVGSANRLRAWFLRFFACSWSPAAGFFQLSPAVCNGQLIKPGGSAGAVSERPANFLQLH